MSKKHRENKGDLDFWLQAISDVTPLRDKRSIGKKKITSRKNIKKYPTKPNPIKLKYQLHTPRASSQKIQQTANPVRGKIPGLDRRTSENLRRGKIKIEGVLDLHGYDYYDAKNLVEQFIEDSYFSNKKCVLVITGKGDRGSFGESLGILKKSFPIWINEESLQNMVLSFSVARPKDGGSGAFYVLLRRKK